MVLVSCIRIFDFAALNLQESFLKRLRHHASLLNNAFTRLMETKDIVQFLIGGQDSSYDDFGLRKVIVAATSVGQIIGMDSKTGEV